MPLDRSTRLAWLVGLIAVAGSALVFEAGCQLYGAYIYSTFEKFKQHPLHYYQESTDPVLAYELKPGVYRDPNGAEAQINRYGMREAGEDRFPDRRRIAVLGDSVAFGFNHSQPDTVSNLVNARLRELDVDAVALNFGVCGYALPEVVRFFQLRDAIYDVHDVVFVLNLNDFALRDGVYEGADDGTYRMYHRSLLMSPWFLRKFVYRMHRRAGSVHWYEWLFDGTREAAFESLRELHAYSRANESRLRVVLLPVGSAYLDDGYALADEHRAIASFLEAEGIPYRDPTAHFGADPARYFDDTDHLRRDGNLLLARIIEDDLVLAPARL